MFKLSLLPFSFSKFKLSCDSSNEFNFILSNGVKTKTGAPETYKVSINPPGSVVRKVSVWCGPGSTVGIQMLNLQGVSLLDIGSKNYDKFDVDLADGQRIEE